MKARKASLLALTSALMAATSASSASAWENPLENPYLEEPLEVCDQGSFFVGGVPKVTKYAAGPTAGDPQQITIGQAYVQFQVPKTRRQWPIVFVHGSTHTGAALDATPDGIPMPCATIWRRSSWTSRGVGVRASPSPCSTK